MTPCEWQRGRGRTPPSALDAVLVLLDEDAQFCSCEPGTQIYSPKNRTGYWYQLTAGAAKRYVVGGSGSVQIVDFVLPGDWFGLSVRTMHEFSIEVIASDTVISRYPYPLLYKALAHHPRARTQLMKAAFQAASRVQRHHEILRRHALAERVAATVLELKRRCSGGGAALTLPMSIDDLANYMLLRADAVRTVVRMWETLGIVSTTTSQGIRILEPDRLESGVEPL